MSRTIIDIPDTQLREVDSLCKLLGISRAEAVRRALRDYMQAHDSLQADGFGLWKAASAVGDATPARRPSAKRGT